jgi:RHS Repeat
VQFEFDTPGGRVMRHVLRQERRGESGSQRSLRYLYEDGRLQRIDEDGQATPALTRRYDGAGRLVEQAERTGAVIARTTWRYDAAGRLVERVVDSGTGSRVDETRRYRRDGTLERLQTKNGLLLGKTIDFDKDERPVRIQVTDVSDRHETVVTYPNPTQAVHATTGFAVGGRGASGRYEYTTRYRVRTPQELRRVEQPALPTMRRHDRGTQHSHARPGHRWRCGTRGCARTCRAAPRAATSTTRSGPTSAATGSSSA